MQPAFLRLHGHIDTPEQLLQMPLLHDEERTTWNQWFVQQGVKRPPRSTGPLFEDGLLTLAGVQAGLGWRAHARAADRSLSEERRVGENLRCGN
jgi:hypothetical protein